MVVVILGIIGAIILAIAWVPETLQIIREKRSRLNPEFSIFYFVGSLLLFVYAILINELIFSIVNGIILLQTCINLYYEFFPKKKRKK